MLMQFHERDYKTEKRQSNKIHVMKIKRPHQSLLYRRALIIGCNKAPLRVLYSSQQLMFLALYLKLRRLASIKIKFLFDKNMN